jgi:hypothetical protein
MHLALVLLHGKETLGMDGILEYLKHVEDFLNGHKQDFPRLTPTVVLAHSSSIA